ncbi:glycoside hydrolase family 32 protein [Polyporus arcularius HHB13444]|uniref:Glycoside hydrolase family 32 protein n=1 Tax=Polyporus arcularius HHB13444 TaxID=1314778 RepID=A0A5C3PFP1_9APHY|nr:glycoside hydrolase family 32 protein [Polyporus arcularius HHB13444]
MRSLSGLHPFHSRYWQWANILLGLVALQCALVASINVKGTAHEDDRTIARTTLTASSGIPALDNYTGLYRPQIHFSPPQEFMNDPNGLHKDAKGTYHLYYQYNPTGLVAGNQHWGHATSKDLYHWENQPIAIYPPTSDSQVFSGSAVIDSNNTSGFFPNQTDGVVAIYTLNSASAEVQEIAYSHDGGYSFTRYDGNPVIDVNSTQFRDPKVIWHEKTQRWVMVVSHAQDFVIAFYTSPDLKAWTLVSNFSHQGLLGSQWECPNLVPMPVRDVASGELIEHQDMYVLAISVNPGAPLGGSATQYFPGTFNGTTFTAIDRTVRLTDFAKDNYAGQFFYGILDDEDPISIAWASNWQYAEEVPTAQEGWRSAMSVPRRNFLANTPSTGWVLVSRPHDLRPVLGQVLVEKEWRAEGGISNASILTESGAVHLNVAVSGLLGSIPATSSLEIVLSTSDSQESLSCGYSFSDNTFFLDRGNTRGFQDPTFTSNFSTSVFPREDGTWTMSAVVDRSIIEVFLNEGVASATSVFFATQPLTSISISTAGLPSGATTKVELRALESVWRATGNDTARV